MKIALSKDINGKINGAYEVSEMDKVGYQSAIELARTNRKLEEEAKKAKEEKDEKRFERIESLIIQLYEEMCLDNGEDPGEGTKKAKEVLYND